MAIRPPCTLSTPAERGPRQVALDDDRGDAEIDVLRDPQHGLMGHDDDQRLGPLLQELVHGARPPRLHLRHGHRRQPVVGRTGRRLEAQQHLRGPELARARVGTPIVRERDEASILAAMLRR